MFQPRETVLLAMGLLVEQIGLWPPKKFIDEKGLAKTETPQILFNVDPLMTIT